DSGAEQRRSIFVGENSWDRVRIVFVNGRVFCVAAIDVISGELGGIAEILETAPAIFTLAAGGVQPGNASAVTFFECVRAAADGVDSGDDLVARDEGKFR